MRKITLIVVTMLLSVAYPTTAKTTSNQNNRDLRITKRIGYSQPIMFVERGIKFLIFQNGKFEFYTNKRPDYSSNYFRQYRSRGYYNNSTYAAPGVSVNYKHNIGLYISHDRYGRVRSVGNVSINYDHHGRVKRIGSVYMKYHHRNLKQIGGLKLQYNQWGDLISTKGNVNYSNQGCGFCGTTGCVTTHLYEDYNDDHHDDWNDYNDTYNDNDYYYYKKGNKSKKYRRSRSR